MPRRASFWLYDAEAAQKLRVATPLFHVNNPPSGTPPAERSILAFFRPSIDFRGGEICCHLIVNFTFGPERKTLPSLKEK